MFFTNEKPEKKSIVRATMAGAHKLTLLSAASPGDLAVDKARNRLYWTDTTMKRIEYADLTGTGSLLNSLYDCHSYVRCIFCQTSKQNKNKLVTQIRTSDNKLSFHWLARLKRFSSETCELSWCGQKRSKKKEKCTVILNFSVVVFFFLKGQFSVASAL